MTENNINIPIGYKDSLLGVIPQEWEVKRLGEIGVFIKGKGIPKNQIKSEGFPCLTYGDLYTKYDYCINNIKSYIDSETAFNSQEIQFGDILFAGSGETIEDIGKCAAYLEKDVAYAGGDIIVFQSTEEINSLTFAYLLNSHQSNKQKYKLGQGQSVVHIYPKHLEILIVAIPPLAEQEKIAKTLSIWDDAIEKQKKIVELLELRKRGLMQQLLTAKIRVGGFVEPLRKHELGDVSSIARGGSPRPIEKYITEEAHGINWIKIGDVERGGKYIYNTKEKIIKDGVVRSRMVHKGDFILSNSMSYGRPYILKIDGCIHDGWLVIQNYHNHFNIDFLYYTLGSEPIQAQYKSLAAGSGVQNLNIDKVKIVIVNIPSLPEQTAIANILTTADQEIDLAKKKLELFRTQKRALMQQLLTGKTRVKLN